MQFIFVISHYFGPSSKLTLVIVTSNNSHWSFQKSVNEESSMDDESFFELLSRFQSKRMDDQRCTLSIDSNKDDQPNQAQQQIISTNREGGSLSSNESTNGTTNTSDSGASKFSFFFFAQICIHCKRPHIETVHNISRQRHCMLHSICISV